MNPKVAHSLCTSEHSFKGSFARTVNVTIFVNGVFNLFDVICEQYYRIAFNPFLNDTENSDVDGTSRRSRNLVSIEVPRSQKFCKCVSIFCLLLFSYISLRTGFVPLGRPRKVLGKSFVINVEIIIYPRYLREMRTLLEMEQCFFWPR